MKIVMLTLLVLGVVTAGRDVPVLGQLSVDPVQDVPGILEVTIPPDTEAIRGYRWATLDFDLDLPVGTEVQLWRDVVLEDPAWDQELDEGLVASWIVDARTGSAIRLDVTDFLKAGRVPDGASIYLRVVAPDGGEAAIAKSQVSNLVVAAGKR